MAAFEGDNGTIRLVRNHEQSEGPAFGARLQHRQAGAVRGRRPAGQPITAATAATDDLELTWVVGDRDGAYASDSGSWSAQAAAARAEAEYQEAGYDQAQRITTAGAHTDYDIPAVVANRLAELGK